MRLLPLFLLLLAATGCEDFLQREPLDQLTEGNFYKTFEDMDRATVAAYSPMQNIEWGGKGWQITEIPSDNSEAGGTDPDFTPIDAFTVTADNGPVGLYWGIHYQQVAYANTVLDKAPDAELTQAQEEQLTAEARFLRAVAYFDLVRIYGAVPLLLTAPSADTELFPSRTPVNEVYDQIKADLTYAAEHLPITAAQDGRATKGAALGVLAKVHLTRREMDDARARAQDVINLGVYSLMPDFGDNFLLETSDNNAESIFQVQYTGCGPFGTGNANQAFFAPYGQGITKDRDGWGSQIPTGPTTVNPGTDIQRAYEEEDLRRYHTIMQPGDFYPMINAEDGGYTYPVNQISRSRANIKKYVVGGGPNVCFMSTPQNLHYLRYADILLVLAESILERQGGTTTDQTALDAFNQVRVRAGLEPAEEITRESMALERRRELAFEGHRWFDLLRTGRAIEVLTIHGKNIAPHNLLFPLPSAELKINTNLTQNPGYN